jgi:hypothetical protein
MAKISSPHNQVARLRIHWGDYLYETRTFPTKNLKALGEFTAIENLKVGETFRLSTGKLSYTVDWVTPKEKLSHFDVSSFRNFIFSLLTTLLSCSFLFYGLDKIEVKAEKPSEEKNWVTLLAPPAPEPPPPPVVQPTLTNENVLPEQKDLIPVKPSQDFKKTPLKLTESAPKNDLDLGDLSHSLSGINQAAVKPQNLPSTDLNSLGLGGLKLSQKSHHEKTESIGKLQGQGKGTFSKLDAKDLGNDPSPTRGSDDSGKGLETSEIQSVVKSRESRIRNCFERQLHSNPNLGGKIVTRFTISGTGKVATVKVIFDSLQRTAVTSCVLSEIRTWIFPAPRGNASVEVEHPFSFEPGN